MPNGQGTRYQYSPFGYQAFAGNFTDGLDDGTMTYESTLDNCTTAHTLTAVMGMWQILEVWDGPGYDEPTALICECTCNTGGGILTSVEDAATVHGVMPWSFNAMP